MRRRTGRHLVAMVASATLVTGCGSDTPVARADGLEVATYEPTGEGGNAALLSGTVEDDGGCLKVSAGDNNVSYVPVFAANDRRVESVQVGSTVELAGGDVPVTGAYFEGFPDSCPQDGPFWVVAQP